MFGEFSGAVVRRVIDRGGAVVPEHAHDWPVLSLFVMGGYLNQAEPGPAFICGPSAVLYRAGAAHRNTAGGVGFEQIEIEFDPAWLGEAIPSAPVSRWIGGSAAGEARRLARHCANGLAEETLRAALRRFLESACRPSASRTGGDAPRWTGQVGQSLREVPSLSVRQLALQAGRHPAWLGTAYRRATGETLAAAAARFRVERAAWLLRETDDAPAQVAADAGFCDQSHMNRTFRRILGRPPSAVRADRARFRA